MVVTDTKIFLNRCIKFKKKLKKKLRIRRNTYVKFSNHLNTEIKLNLEHIIRVI